MEGDGFNPKSAALALGRWGLGVLFLFNGIAKFPNLSGFVHGFLLTNRFEETWLPPVVVIPFGYALPFLEVILGVLLLLGIRRNQVLFATGLLLLTLVFGQILLRQPQVVFANLGYLFFTAILLFAGREDRWVILCSEPEAAESDRR
jgi:thiosulfate dehydrogenase (quinone) large subunit